MGGSDACKKHLNSIGKEFYTNGLGCNGTFDTLLCWEATAANTTLKQQCPEFEGIFDTSKFVYKYCTEYGYWENPEIQTQGINDTILIGGKTNYLKYCLSDAANIYKPYLVGGGGDINSTILLVNRYFELAGLCLSLVSICLSLFIFFYFKTLIRNQTKIHINLLIAILIQVTLRIIIYIDQFVGKSDEIGVNSATSKHTQGLCQTLYILLQFSLSSMFMWMLVEGFYLNFLLMNALFDENKHRIMVWFYAFGWGLPVFLVLPWVVVMLLKFGVSKVCWLGYDKMKYYWILQSPRFIFMAINVICLINVIRVLVTKLRDDRTENTNIVKKGLKAAILLLPLLGIAHILNFFDPPKQPVLYIIFTFVTSFLLMYQGFFVSVLYCFLNNEVKKVLKRFWVNKIRIQGKLKNNKNNKNNKRVVLQAANSLEKQQFLLVENHNDDKSKSIMENI